MIIFAIDDEALSLEGLTDAITSASPGAEVYAFQSAREALAFAGKKAPDTVFLDIEMRDMSGIEAASGFLKMYPKINIIFATGYQEYMPDAFRLHASGYITKPITPAKVRTELQNLRHEVAGEGKCSLRFRAFGEFEVFDKDQPVTFDYAKTRELLAFLVDRNGSLCTSGMLMDALWEDSEGTIRHASYLRNLRSDLKRVLREHQAEDILVQRRGLLGIDRTLVSCDYYDYLDGKLSADAFEGEYMNQYSWAECRIALLEDKKERLNKNS